MSLAYDIFRFVSGPLDDSTAIKRAKAKFPKLAKLTTSSVMVTNIRQGTLSVSEADAIKEDWLLNHRFTLKLATFVDLINKIT